MKFLAMAFTLTGILLVDQGWADTPLLLERKIPLGDVRGRIDHLAVDLKRNRLFVAELGNDTVGVVDLNEQKVQHVITGLKEPQGIGYVPSSDTLFVANASDGSVLIFHGADYAAAGRIELGDDADNVRVDSVSNRVFVGYGTGALAVIDPATNGKIADISLQAHPESFQLARSDRRIFVNVPKAREMAVVDRFASKQTVAPGQTRDWLYSSRAQAMKASSGCCQTRVHVSHTTIQQREFRASAAHVKAHRAVGRS
jgi:hypothetical protein